MSPFRSSLSSDISTTLSDLFTIAAPRERLRRPTFWMTCLILLGTWVLFEKEGASVWASKFGTSLFSWLWKAWHDQVIDAAQGKFVPWIVGFLLIWRRREILRWPAVPDMRAFVPIVLALIVHWMGMRGQIPRLSVLAFILLLWSMVWLFQGWPRAREMMFPFSFLVFMIPMNFLETMVAFPLRMGVTKLSASLSHLIGIEVIREGTRIHNLARTFEYDIAPACGGIRSLTSMVMISILAGYLTQDRFWKKATVFIASIPLAIIANVARLMLIILWAQIGGQSGGNWAHEYLGWVSYVVVIVLLFFLCSYLESHLPKVRNHS